MRTPPTIACLLISLVLGPTAVLAARDPAPGFFEQALDLPGIPAAVIPADLTGDGRDDLVVLVAFTTWDSISRTEKVTFDDIEGLVEVMNVVSALLDRRELRVYPGLANGGFGEPLPPLELDTSVHALEAGHQTEPLIAVTDEGVAAVRLQHTADGPRLELVALFDVLTSFSGSGAFYSDLTLLHDLDDDGRIDIVLPTETGWTTHRGTTTGFEPEPAAHLVLPEPRRQDDDEAEEDDAADDAASEADDALATAGEEVDHPDEGGTKGDEAGHEGKQISIGASSRDEDSDDEDSDDEDSDDEDSDDEDASRRARIRIPETRDINGDGALDLVLPGDGRRVGPVVYLNNRERSFDPPIELELPEGRSRNEEIAFVGDLDGDAIAEVVSQEELEPPDEAGFRQEIDAAKRPRFTYRLYRLGDGLELADEPYRTFGAIGYVFQGSDEHDEEIDVRLPGGFEDLDGDGRHDLVAITLDFSLLPLIVRALVMRSISFRMDFHPWCQQATGGFREVPDLDLSGKFRINFRNVQIKHLSQFAGDFNGDGRKDFVQLGRGKKVTIHQGGPDCTYPRKPDRKLRFEREPKHLGLVRILDLDRNGRSDIYVVQPLRDPKTGESIPVRLDLYLAE